MKNKFFPLLGLSSLLVFSACNKSQDVQDVSPNKEVDISSVSSTIPLSITPSALVAPTVDETTAEQKYYSAVYQLTDAMRASMTSTMLTYLYDEYDVAINDPNHEGALGVFYDDLFLAFPTLEADIDAHLLATDYGLTYEYDSYDALSAALEWNGVSEDAAIWVGNYDYLPAGYSPSIADYAISTTIQLDEDDLSSEDAIFSWNIENGTPATEAIGETAAQNLGKIVLISGTSFKTGFIPDPRLIPPGVGQFPPYVTGNPWTDGGDVILNRLYLEKRFERNKHSEIRMCIKWGTHNGDVIGGVFNRYVVNLHKNDFNTHKWISPTTICALIDNTIDLVHVYNLYEYDWYGQYYVLGGFADPANIYNGWKPQPATGYDPKINGKMAHSNEFYLAQPGENHSANVNARIAHPQCYTIYTNTDLTHFGTNGEVLLKHN